MILEAMVAMGKDEEAFRLVGEIAAVLGEADRWMSTQSTACALVSIARYAGKYAQGGASDLQVKIGSRNLSPDKDRFLTSFTSTTATARWPST
jgi:alpha-2-macroglobulin